MNDPTTSTKGGDNNNQPQQQTPTAIRLPPSALKRPRRQSWTEYDVDLLDNLSKTKRFASESIASDLVSKMALCTPSGSAAAGLSSPSPLPMLGIGSPMSCDNTPNDRSTSGFNTSSRAGSMHLDQQQQQQIHENVELSYIPHATANNNNNNNNASIGLHPLDSNNLPTLAPCKTPGGPGTQARLSRLLPPAAAGVAPTASAPSPFTASKLQPPQSIYRRQALPMSPLSLGERMLTSPNDTTTDLGTDLRKATLMRNLMLKQVDDKRDSEGYL